MTEPSELIPPGWGVALESISVPKDAKADELGYSFRSIEAVAKAAREACSKAGIMIIPQEIEVVDLQRGETTMPGAYGSRTRVTTRVILRVTWRVRWGNSEITAQTLGEGVDVGDKAFPKAMTYAWKDLLRTFFLLGEAEQDPDATDMSEAVSELHTTAKPVIVAKSDPEPVKSSSSIKGWAEWVKVNLGNFKAIEQRELIQQGLARIDQKGTLPSRLPADQQDALKEEILKLVAEYEEQFAPESDLEDF